MKDEDFVDERCPVCFTLLCLAMCDKQHETDLISCFQRRRLRSLYQDYIPQTRRRIRLLQTGQW
jgi:hypothetical protein